jgi:threonine/homoserine/homoserine lactone efflux protein
VVAIAATLYFGYLAYRIAAPPLSYTRADRNPSPLIPGILLSLDNPKA